MRPSTFFKIYEIKMCMQLADAVTKGQYEYVLTTHIDKGHVNQRFLYSCPHVAIPRPSGPLRASSGAAS